MAVNTFALKTTYTANLSLQPDRSTPSGLPTWSDGRPSQVAEGELTLPANLGTPIVLPVPASWSNVYGVYLVNTDPTGYVQLVTYGGTVAAPNTPVNATLRILQPQGGQYCESVYTGTQTLVAYARPFQYTLQAVDSNGNYAASTATNLYYYIVGA